MLDALQEHIETSSSMPLTGKVMINEETVLGLIDKVREALPDELMRARNFVRDRQKLTDEVKARCDAMYEETRKRADMLIDKESITQEAYSRANEIVRNAQLKAQELRSGANVYVDDVLAQLEKSLDEWADTMRKNRLELQQDLKNYSKSE